VVVLALQQQCDYQRDASLIGSHYSHQSRQSPSTEVAQYSYADRGLIEWGHFSWIPELMALLANADSHLSLGLALAS